MHRKEKYARIDVENPLRSIARKFRHKNKWGDKLNLLSAFGAAVQTHGLSYAISKAKRYWRHEASEPSEPRIIEQLLTSDQEHYLMERSAQNTYLVKHMEYGGVDLTHFDCFREHHSAQVTERGNHEAR